MTRISKPCKDPERNNKERMRYGKLNDSITLLGTRIGVANRCKQEIIDTAIRIIQENEEKQKKAQVEIEFLKADLGWVTNKLNEALKEVEQLQNKLKSLGHQQQQFPSESCDATTSCPRAFDSNESLFSASQMNNVQQPFYDGNYSMMIQQGFTENVYPTPPPSRSSCPEETPSSLQMSQPMNQQQETGQIQNAMASAPVQEQPPAQPSVHSKPFAASFPFNTPHQSAVHQMQSEAPKPLQNSVVSAVSPMEINCSRTAIHCRYEDQDQFRPATVSQAFDTVTPPSSPPFEFAVDEFAPLPSLESIVPSRSTSNYNPYCQYLNLTENFGNNYFY